MVGALWGGGAGVDGSARGSVAVLDPPYLVPVAARECGLDRDGYVKCDQPATLPVTVLGPRAGRLNPAAVGRVDAALRFVLDV